MKLCEASEAPASVRRLAVYTIGQLCRNLNFADYASRIVHPFARILDSSPLQTTTTTQRQPPKDLLLVDLLDTLCVLIYHMGPSFAIFIPMINKVITKQNFSHEKYETLVIKVLKSQTLLSSDLPVAARPQSLVQESKENSGQDDLGMDSSGELPRLFSLFLRAF
jgi:FKBP12-rapamycin complex-associated protein